ncbi:MAG TPA: hypothetical protein VGH14_00415 [Solirubrobacterales bacterium]|jgi:hypothetical protein
MAEDWKLEALERRVDELEKVNRKREEWQWWWIERIWWTLLVAGATTYIVLGHVHHR